MCLNISHHQAAVVITGFLTVLHDILVINRAEVTLVTLYRFSHCFG